MSKSVRHGNGLIRLINTMVLLCSIALSFQFAATAKAADISSPLLSIDVDQKFPAIRRYTWIADGSVLYGQEDNLSQVKLNGTAYTPSVTFAKTAPDTAVYALDFPALQIAMTVKIQVKDNVLSWDVTNIDEKGTVKVSTIEIPDHNLVSVRSTQAGAALSAAKMHTAVSGSGDVFAKVDAALAGDAEPRKVMYAFLNTALLAAGIWTNAIEEAADTDGRVHLQTRVGNGYTRTGIWSGSWLYRPDMAKTAEPLPSVKVVVAKDLNHDGVVDWQDAAIACRAVAPKPYGSEKIADLVVQRIPYNFASQATNPFTKTLDETKRVYLATDGLGQFLLLKGYGGEGHDSNHPDYGHIGQNQGSVADLNLLVDKGAAYHAAFGVHLNGTEAYPEAAPFDETLINAQERGWDYLDQAYLIRKRVDSTSGRRLARLKELKSEVPNLSFIYWDVWRTHGWDSREAARETNSLGWGLMTEFPMDHEAESLWSHWAVDVNYGDQSIKGFNSRIARFLHNHEKDTWIAGDPLLGGTELQEFEGWQGELNFDAMIETTFSTDLPTKYLQHFKITQWTSDKAVFEGGVSASLDGTSKTRTIIKDGHPVLIGDTYLLPWSPLDEAKLYHWNARGGITSWSLPAGWSGLKSVKLYALSDQGRKLVGTLPVTDNRISIEAKAKQAYVVYKDDAPALAPVHFGEGALVENPSFDSGDLSGWTVHGMGAQVQRNARGQYELVIDKSTGATISQTVHGLAEGRYYAYVYVSTGARRKATLGVRDYGGREVSQYADTSQWYNTIAGDSKANTMMQRMAVSFDVPANSSSATLYLKADKGDAQVVFSDVRVARLMRNAEENEKANPTHAYFVQDFEDMPGGGLYPFIKGATGGSTDPQIHRSELHAPYTQKGWNGKAIDDVIGGHWSLKIHEPVAGMQVQTIPQTLRFVAGTRYKVSFKYETEKSGTYSLVIGDGGEVVRTIPLDAATAPYTLDFIVDGAASGNSWFGIFRADAGKEDFVLDDLVVDVVKPVSGRAARSAAK